MGSFVSSYGMKCILVAVDYMSNGWKQLRFQTMKIKVSPYF